MTRLIKIFCKAAYEQGYTGPYVTRRPDLDPPYKEYKFISTSENLTVKVRVETTSPSSKQGQDARTAFAPAIFERK